MYKPDIRTITRDVVEFHDRSFEDRRMRTKQIIGKMKNNGYKIFAVSESFEEVSLINKNAPQCQLEHCPHKKQKTPTKRAGVFPNKTSLMKQLISGFLSVSVEYGRPCISHPNHPDC